MNLPTTCGTQAGFEPKVPAGRTGGLSEEVASEFWILKPSTINYKPHLPGGIDGRTSILLGSVLGFILSKSTTI